MVTGGIFRNNVGGLLPYSQHDHSPGHASGRKKKRRRLSRIGRFLVALLSLVIFVWIYILWHWLFHSSSQRDGESISFAEKNQDNGFPSKGDGGVDDEKSMDRHLHKTGIDPNTSVNVSSIDKKNENIFSNGDIDVIKKDFYTEDDTLFNKEKLKKTESENKEGSIESIEKKKKAENESNEGKIEQTETNDNQTEYTGHNSNSGNNVHKREAENYDENNYSKQKDRLSKSNVQENREGEKQWPDVNEGNEEKPHYQNSTKIYSDAANAKNDNNEVKDTKEKFGPAENTRADSTDEQSKNTLDVSNQNNPLIGLVHMPARKEKSKVAENMMNFESERKKGDTKINLENQGGKEEDGNHTLSRSTSESTNTENLMSLVNLLIDSNASGVNIRDGPNIKDILSIMEQINNGDTGIKKSTSDLLPIVNFILNKKKEGTSLSTIISSIANAKDGVDSGDLTSILNALIRKKDDEKKDFDSAPKVTTLVMDAAEKDLKDNQTYEKIPISNNMDWNMLKMLHNFNEKKVKKENTDSHEIAPKKNIESDNIAAFDENMGGRNIIRKKENEASIHTDTSSTNSQLDTNQESIHEVKSEFPFLQEDPPAYIHSLSQSKYNDKRSEPFSPSKLSSTSFSSLSRRGSLSHVSNSDNVVGTENRSTLQAPIRKGRVFESSDFPYLPPARNNQNQYQRVSGIEMSASPKEYSIYDTNDYIHDQNESKKNKRNFYRADSRGDFLFDLPRAAKKKKKQRNLSAL